MANSLVLEICFFSFLGLSLLALGVFRWSEGLWGNLILAFNLTFTSIFMYTGGGKLVEMGAEALDGVAKVPLFAWANLFYWLGFGITLLILQKITKSLSSVKVRYPALFESIFNLVAMFGVWAIFISNFLLELGINLYIAGGASGGTPTP
jgi:hypothetical protein